MIKIILNGELYVTNAHNIAELIDEVGVQAKIIALAQNTQVVQTKDWQNTAICQDDEIEILQFMGGG